MTELQTDHRHRVRKPRRASRPANADPRLRDAVAEVLAQLDAGKLRVAEKIGGRVDHAPVDQEGGAAVVPPRGQRGRARRLHQLLRQGAGQVRRLRRAGFQAGGFRVVPPAVVRRGSFIARNVVLMPSYVNIGAYVDEGDDGRYLGDRGFLRADRQERAPVRRRGHRRRAGAGAGQSDHHRGRLLHRRALRGRRGRDRRRRARSSRWASTSARARRSTTARPARSLYGRIPPGSVVVSGNLPSADGKYSLYCAVIVKQVDAKTRAKTSINELLRGD